MAPEEEPLELVYRVVVNHEEQYSVWWTSKPLPAGWREEGTRGSRAECLEAIERLWTDLRPWSLRQAFPGEP